MTAQESVDILGLDVCSMAGVENCYEWRPGTDRFSADYILASAPLSAAWAYDELLGRLQPAGTNYHTADSSYFQGGLEYTLDPKTMQPQEFTELIIEEIYDSQRWASWVLLDNKKISSVKRTMDALAKQCTKEPKSLMLSLIENTLTYFHGASENSEQAELALPYRDAYGFVEQIAKSEEVTSETRSLAVEALKHIDQFVVHSYYGRGFFPDNPQFIEGKYGAYLVLPQGNRIYAASGQNFWAHTSWFHPNDQRGLANSYGLYDWCREGAEEGNNRVDNFFEYLDWLFDTSNEASGGQNSYQW